MHRRTAPTRYHQNHPPPTTHYPPTAQGWWTSQHFEAADETQCTLPRALSLAPTPVVPTAEVRARLPRHKAGSPTPTHAARRRCCQPDQLRSNQTVRMRALQPSPRRTTHLGGLEGAQHGLHGVRELQVVQLVVLLQYGNRTASSHYQSLSSGGQFHFVCPAARTMHGPPWGYDARTMHGAP